MKEGGNLQMMNIQICGDKPMNNTPKPNNIILPFAPYISAHSFEVENRSVTMERNQGIKNVKSKTLIPAFMVNR